MCSLFVTIRPDEGNFTLDLRAVVRFLISATRRILVIMELDQSQCYCIENVFNGEETRTGQRLLKPTTSESCPHLFHSRDVHFLPHIGTSRGC